MKWHKNLLFPILILSSAIIFSSCSDSNPLSPNTDEEFNNPTTSADNSVTLSMLAQINSTTQSKSNSGNSTLAVDNITINEVKMLVNELELESIENDSLDFQANNLVVELPVDGSPVVISSRSVPLGVYDELDIFVDKPDENSNVGDADFDDGQSQYAVVIRGTKDGNDFTFRSQEDFYFKLDFEPPLEITNSTNSVDIDVMVKVEEWFKAGLNGRTLDPSNPDDIKLIENNIENSFETRHRVGNNNDDHRDDGDDDHRDDGDDDHHGDGDDDHHDDGDDDHHDDGDDDHHDDGDDDHHDDGDDDHHDDGDDDHHDDGDDDHRDDGDDDHHDDGDDDHHGDGNDDHHDDGDDDHHDDGDDDHDDN